MNAPLSVGDPCSGRGRDGEEESKGPGAGIVGRREAWLCRVR